MPISSLVLTYADTHESDAALELLTRDARIELGHRVGRRQAAVIETVSRDEDKDLWRWLHHLPGITHVDVVFVSLVDDEPASASTDAPRTERGLTPRQVNT